MRKAHGAKIAGRTVGTYGHAASFSFYPGKNLGAYGDAGCMATNDAAIAGKTRMISQHGQKGKHNHLIEGRNSRLDGLQALILLAKLPHLEKWTEARIGAAKKYDHLLRNAGVLLADKDGRPSCLSPVCDPDRGPDRLQGALTDGGIETAIHYPTALPFLPCYQQRDLKPGDFPVAHCYQKSILSLPLFPN